MGRCVWALINEEITDHLGANHLDYPKQWFFLMIETLLHQRVYHVFFRMFIMVLVTVGSVA